MSILGNIFKRKLDQRQFEFKEEYWKNLEAKLDTYDKKGGGGHGHWLYYSMGIVAIFSFSAWYFYSGKSIESGNILSSKNDVSATVFENTPKEQSSGELVTSENGQEADLTPEITENLNKEKNIETSPPIAKKTKTSFEKSVPVTGNETAENDKKGEISIPEKKSNAFLIKEEAKGKTAKTTTLVPAEKTVVSVKEVAETQQETTNKTKTNSTPKEDITDSKTGQIDVTISKNKQALTDPKTSSTKNADFSEENKNLVFEASFQPETNANKENIPSSESPSLTAAHETKSNLLFMKRLFPPALPGTTNNVLSTTHSENTGTIRKSSFFAGAYSGIMYTGKILKNKDASLQEYIDRRNSEEEGMLSANMGIDAGVSFNRWNISSGINLHQQGEIIDYRSEFYQWLKNSTSSWNVQDNSYWTKDTTDTYSVLIASGYWQTTDTTVSFWNSSLQANVTDTISIQQYIVDTTYNQYYYVTDSSLIPQFDSTPTVKIDSVNKLVDDPALKPPQTTTKISYVEIPLMIGYEFPVNRFTLMVRTGFSLGLLSKFDATYLKNDISGTGQVEISRQNKTLFNYLLRAGLLYNISEKMAISFEPMFRMNINSVLKDAGFTQQYWNAGLNAGVVYRF